MALKHPSQVFKYSWMTKDNPKDQTVSPDFGHIS